MADSEWEDGHILTVGFVASWAIFFSVSIIIVILGYAWAKAVIGDWILLWVLGCSGCGAALLTHHLKKYVEHKSEVSE